MKPYYQDDAVTIYHGDCLQALRAMPENSVDSVVTDPPYGLSFMGKKWDYDVPGVDVWREVFRVLKPGGHLLSFAGTRTHHRMVVNIEDAGFEIRDMIAWVYGSGFPKSLDVSKAIDRAAGATREVVGNYGNKDGVVYGMSKTRVEQGARPTVTTSNGDITAPATDAARQWQGWGTALKPALEPICVARKPLCGTVAENVLAWGTGAINVDGCRISGEPWKAHRTTGLARDKFFTSGPAAEINKEPHSQGRWPANLIHNGSEDVVGLMGNAARFMYCPKASKKDRDEGCEGLEERPVLIGAEGHKINPMTGKPVVDVPRRNHHPTVKPTDLMRYLCRLVTFPGGLVLDPFMGSGSTGKAAILEGFRFIGIERDAEYCEIARRRIHAAADQQEVIDFSEPILVETI